MTQVTRVAKHHGVACASLLRQAQVPSFLHHIQQTKDEIIELAEAEGRVIVSLTRTSMVSRRPVRRHFLQPERRDWRRCIRWYWDWVDYIEIKRMILGQLYEDSFGPVKNLAFAYPGAFEHFIHWDNCRISSGSRLT